LPCDESCEQFFFSIVPLPGFCHVDDTDSIRSLVMLLDTEWIESRDWSIVLLSHSSAITINQLLFVLGGHRLVTKQRLCDDPVWNTIVSRTQRTATAAGTTEIKISLSLSTGHRGCQVSD